MSSRLRRWLLGTLIALFAVICLVVITVRLSSLPRPASNPDANADEFARALMEAVDHAAWERTDVLMWEVFGHKHLWDKRRGYAHVVWDRYRVLLRLQDRSGLVFEDGEALIGEAAVPHLETAYALWCNDAFWLNPFAKLFDAGVQRTLLQYDGRDALLVQFDQGGVTAGDAYLFTTSDDGKPDAWRMWVSVLPVGGLRTTWEAWTQLESGAWISTLHRIGPVGFRVQPVRDAQDVPTLTGGEDPFLLLGN